MAHFSALSVAAVVVVVLVAAVVLDAAPVAAPDRERRDAFESIRWRDAEGRALCGVKLETEHLESKPKRSVEKVSCLPEYEGRTYDVGADVYRCMTVQTTHKYFDGSFDQSIDINSGCIAVLIPSNRVNPTAAVTDS